MTSSFSPWFQRIPLRTRVLLISSAAVALVLAVGGILVLLLLRAELIDTAEDPGEDRPSRSPGSRMASLPSVLAATEESPRRPGREVRSGDQSDDHAVGAKAFRSDELQPGQSHPLPGSPAVRRGRAFPGRRARNRDAHG